jgi:signal transduction histidine kinase
MRLRPIPPLVRGPLARLLAPLGPRPGDPRVALLAGVLAPIAGLIVRVLLLGDLGAEVAFITFYPAVAVAAWSGGLLGGAVATAVSAALAAVFVMTPTSRLAVDNPLGLLVFVVSGLVISALGGGLHTALAASERARARAAFLAQASAVLNQRLDRRAAVEELAGVAVPGFADWCAVDLIEPDGRFGAVGIAHRDPDKVALGHRLRREYPIDPSANTGVPAIARSREPEVMLELPDYGPMIEDERLREIMVGLRLRSYIGVPLVTPDGTAVGVLSLFMSDSDRRFTTEDVDTALDLGRRAGTALDHATLFERLSVQRDELDAVTQALADGVIVADGRGVVRTMNPAARRLLGDMATRTLDEILDGLRDVEGSPDARMVPGTSRFVVPLVLENVPPAAGSRIVILRDVTPVLETEAARDAFVGMLSHELRTPITTIYGSAQVLRRPIDPEIRSGLVDDIADESYRLYRLVEDLLVLSRFERGRLDIVPEPVLVHRVVGAVINRESERTPGLTVDMEVAPDVPAALADPTYVEQIARNLVTNAAKYAGPTATITVRVEATDTDVRLTFEDDGPGIPEADLERVFALYERLGAGRMQPGAGIGLFVCRQLAVAMGGSMTAVRGAGGGAQFRVDLPRAIGAHAAPDGLELPSRRVTADHAPADDPEAPSPV